MSSLNFHRTLPLSELPQREAQMKNKLVDRIISVYRARLRLECLGQVDSNAYGDLFEAQESLLDELAAMPIQSCEELASV